MPRIYCSLRGQKRPAGCLTVRLPHHSRLTTPSSNFPMWGGVDDAQWSHTEQNLEARKVPFISCGELSNDNTHSGEMPLSRLSHARGKITLARHSKRQSVSVVNRDVGPRREIGPSCRRAQICSHRAIYRPLRLGLPSWRKVGDLSLGISRRFRLATCETGSFNSQALCQVVSWSSWQSICLLNIGPQRGDKICPALSLLPVVACASLSSLRRFQPVAMRRKKSRTGCNRNLTLNHFMVRYVIAHM